VQEEEKEEELEGEGVEELEELEGVEEGLEEVEGRGRLLVLASDGDIIQVDNSDFELGKKIKM
jgi:hypothetical protein